MLYQFVPADIYHCADQKEKPKHLPLTARSGEGKVWGSEVVKLMFAYVAAVRMSSFGVLFLAVAGVRTEACCTASSLLGGGGGGAGHTASDARRETRCCCCYCCGERSGKEE